jgi:hypothetical protein
MSLWAGLSQERLALTPVSTLLCSTTAAGDFREHQIARDDRSREQRIAVEQLERTKRAPDGRTG